MQQSRGDRNDLTEENRILNYQSSGIDGVAQAEPRFSSGRSGQLCKLAFFQKKEKLFEYLNFMKKFKFEFFI